MLTEVKQGHWVRILMESQKQVYGFLVSSKILYPSTGTQGVSNYVLVLGTGEPNEQAKCSQGSGSHCPRVTWRA